MSIVVRNGAEKRRPNGGYRFQIDREGKSGADILIEYLMEGRL